jgi:two-component system, response regulator YesN
MIDILLQHTRIHFDRSTFVVIIFAPDQFVELDETQKNLFTFNLTAVAEELTGEQAYGIAEAIDGAVNAVALLINGDSEILETADRISRNVLDFFLESFDIQLFAVIGPDCDSLREIGSIYRKTRKLVKYRMYYPDTNIVRSTRMREEYIGNYQYPFDSEERLHKAIISGDSIETRKESYVILNFVRCQKIEPELVRGIYVSIFNNLMKDVIPAGFSTFEDTRKDISRFIVQSFTSVTVMADRFVDILIRIASEMAEAKRSDGAKLAAQLKNRIDAEYSEYSLSLKVLEADFGYSSSYLTRVFKTHIGVTLKAYLDSVRLEKAKELLSRTGQPLEAIIPQIGFVDVSNFCRKFKHEQGLTPLQYRRLHTEDPAISNA